MNDKFSFMKMLEGKPTLYDYVLENIEKGKPMALFQKLNKRKQNTMSIPKLRQYFLRKGCVSTHVETTLNHIMKERIYGI